MISELLWGSNQQVRLLLCSALVGIGLGVVFDVANGIDRMHTNARRFVLDLLYCCFAAVVTFFTGLVLNHGELHPVLFIGIGLGTFLEHGLIGRFVSKYTFRFVQFSRNLLTGLGVLIRKILHFLIQRIPINRFKSLGYKKIP